MTDAVATAPAEIVPVLPTRRELPIWRLWLMGPRGERPAGLLAVHQGGMAGPAVISGMSRGDMVGLTVEPASGSLKPTSAPVLMISPQGH